MALKVPLCSLFLKRKLTKMTLSKNEIKLAKL